MDSKPIDSIRSDGELQLTEKESPNLTTALGGFIWTGQGEVTGCPGSAECVRADRRPGSGSWDALTGLLVFSSSNSSSVMTHN